MTRLQDQVDTHNNMVTPTDLRSRDVVLGKMASGNFASPGNRLFKQFLTTKKLTYRQISSHSGKKRFLVECIDEWCGRFLFRETTLFCTVVTSDDDQKKLLRKVNAMMRNLPCPVSSSQETVLTSCQDSSSTSSRLPKTRTISFTSSLDESLLDGNESQSVTRRSPSQSDNSYHTRERPTFSRETKEIVTQINAKQTEDMVSDAVIISSSSSDSDEYLSIHHQQQSRKTPTARLTTKMKTHSSISPTSIAAFHQMQDEERIMSKDSCQWASPN